MTGSNSAVQAVSSHFLFVGEPAQQIFKILSAGHPFSSTRKLLLPNLATSLVYHLQLILEGEGC